MPLTINNKSPDSPAPVATAAAQSILLQDQEAAAPAPDASGLDASGLDASGLDGFVDIHDVERLSKYTRRSIQRFINEGTFPEPIYLSNRRRVWRVSEVAAWLDQQEAEGRGKPTPKVCGA